MSTTVQTETLIPSGTWSVDPAHSRVDFQVRHLGIARVRGNFESFAGTLRIGDDLESAEAYGTVDIASINTEEDARDAHLRSPDFFDAERYPQAEFTSTSIRQTGEGKFEVTGELALHGVTREITLNAEVTGTEEDPSGNQRVGLEITGQFDRSDYGMTFNQVLGSGNVLVSDAVRLSIDISAVKEA